MKPFRFSLQSVRVIRERKEQAAQQKYAAALREHERAAAGLQKANDELAGSWESLCRDLASGASAADLRRARAWCAALETRQQERAAELRQARYALDAASQELMNAARDRQALDRLHDKHRRNYDREIQREEQKVLDEMGLRPGLIGLRSNVQSLRSSDFRLQTSDFRLQPESPATAALS
jgi:flagellar protein FliJ